MKRITTLILALNFVTLAFGQEEISIKWRNPATSDSPVIASQAWTNEVQSIYHRLPARAEKAVRRKEKSNDMLIIFILISPRLVKLTLF